MIGIIGCGKMGEWFAERLRNKFKVGVYDIIDEKALKASIKHGLKKYDCLIDLVKDSDIIIVATPISVVKDVLLKIKEVISSEKLSDKVVFDISSVKSSVYPILRSFPKNVKVCSIHPMFGPGAISFTNHNLIIVPIEGREEDSEIVKKLFQELGSRITVSKLKEHEEMIGVTLGLMYLIGLALGKFVAEFGREKLERFSGTSFQYLLNYSKVVLGESVELIWNLFNSSRFKDSFKRFMETLSSVVEKSRDKSELEKLINDLKREFGETEVNESYKKFYEVIYELLK